MEDMVRTWAPEDFWLVARPLIPVPVRSGARRVVGRKRADDRAVLAAVVYLVQARCSWWIRGGVRLGRWCSNSLLGDPDIGLLTLSELVEHVAVIRDAVGFPLVVNADTGFGNPINVRRTVHMLERAGADAIQLEDQVEPKRCGHFASKQVISATDMVRKVEAVLDARASDDLLIIARTDARAMTGLDDAGERANLYREAGADLVGCRGKAQELAVLASSSA